MIIKASLYFSFITIIYLCPSISMPMKGILGILFIIVSSTESGFTGSLSTAILLNFLQLINILNHSYADYKLGLSQALIGTAVYFFVAIYLGRSADNLKNKNIELQTEIDMRRSVEKELKDSLAILESLMSTLPTPVCYKDLNFKFTGCNAAYEEYFGLCEKDILGKNSHELFEPDVAGPCYEMDVDLLENKSRQAKEVSFISKGGRRKYFIFTKALLTDEEGQPSGIVSVFLDTTEHKEHEILKRSVEEEKRVIDEMQKYDRLKTEFFSNISHELRTPLNVIFCAVQLLEMNLENDEFSRKQGFVKKNVMSIRQNSLRLLRLVNNLIDITKIDAQSFEIHRRNQDIVYVVREIVLSVADYITNKGLKLNFHSDIEQKIMAFDEEKLERILLNLLSNAIKFSPLGESIYVNLSETGDGISIRVSDRGIGIPPDRQQNIFERFYQISPINTRLQEGSGIGLNLVKSLVEMHQGRISVESEYGKGTTFIVDLPGMRNSEDTERRLEFMDRHSRIEKIQLEFSDIYLTNSQDSKSRQLEIPM